MMYKIDQCQVIIDRLREPRKFLQVVMGPRQVGIGLFEHIER